MTKIELLRIIQEARQKGKRPDLRDANLQDADLQDANLRWADLRRADLQDAKLRGADLQGADLRWAKLRWADLQGANLRGANLRRADLQEAKLQGADLRDAKLPSPTMVLLAGWGKLSDELTRDLMRLDASGHPERSEPFTQWAKHEEGDCPYNNCKYQRVANFKERKECWSPGRPPALIDLVERVLKEKTKNV